MVEFSPLISHGEIHLLGTACDLRECEAPASLAPQAEWFACGNLNDPMPAWCSRHPNNCTPGIPSSSLASPGDHLMFFFFPPGRFCNAVAAQLSLPDPVCNQAAPKAQTGGFTFPLITEHDSCGFLSLISLRADKHPGLSPKRHCPFEQLLSSYSKSS